MEIFSFEQNCNNRLVASFEFDNIFNDPNIIITNVKRLVDRFEIGSQFRHPHKLIVILSTDSKNYICIVDIRLNTVINTIEFPFNLTCIEVILSGPKTNVENMPLIKEICCMNGCLAVGSEGGLVFFIDLILDSFSQEPLIPKKISMITHNNSHIEMKNKRRTAIFHNQVICIPLNIEAKNKGKFNYRADDGSIIACFQINHIFVSALHYIPQLAMICVGYNFGGFHFYNLNTFNLECYSNIEDGLLPVISFAYQAPENDPTNYSYVWLVRGVFSKMANLDQSPINSLSTAYIYSLCYQNKTIIENYGVFYDTFKLCYCKFEFPLISSYYEKTLNLNCSSRLLDMFTINQILPYKSVEDEEARVFPIDFNYFLIAWETFEKNRIFNTYFAIFDLNQWYKSQMPKNFCLDKDGFCSFISLYSLNLLSNTFNNNSIQAIYCPSVSLVKFNSNMFYCDIHSYPLSLSFNMTIASNDQLCNIYYYGIQKRVISRINSILNLKDLTDNSQELLTNCLKRGLISNENLQTINETSMEESKFFTFQLLNIALENNLNSLLINFLKTDESLCIIMDYQLINEWIWNRVQYIKNSIDFFTNVLFDTSGCNVSHQEISKLVCYETHLSTLSILLNLMFKNVTTITKLNFDELKARIEIVELIRTYLKFILIFENFGLLPNKVGQITKTDPIYSYQDLSDYYCNRRKDLININSSFLKQNAILLIDILVENYLTTIWDIDENNEFSGLYPPKNFSSLLEIFLLESIPFIYKQAILLYFIYDLSDCWSNYPCLANKLTAFTTMADFDSGIRNFVNGLWFLDHQNYETALQLFTHPLVTESLNDFKINIDLFNELLHRIMELFVFENEYKKAMILAMSCNHLLLDKEKSENLYIQILLLNGNLTGAFEFQRHRRSETNSYHLLRKIFFVCEKMNSLMKICRMPLDTFEENVFIDYLKSSTTAPKMILVLYFILNNKLKQAINIVIEFGDDFLNDEENKDILELVNAYMSVLPNLTSKDIDLHVLNKNLAIQYKDQFVFNGGGKILKQIEQISEQTAIQRYYLNYFDLI